MTSVGGKPRRRPGMPDDLKTRDYQKRLTAVRHTPGFKERRWVR